MRQLRYYSADITSPDQINGVFEQIVTHLRAPLRGLVACAGNLELFYSNSLLFVTSDMLQVSREIALLWTTLWTNFVE